MKKSDIHAGLYYVGKSGNKRFVHKITLGTVDEITFSDDGPSTEKKTILLKSFAGWAVSKLVEFPLKAPSKRVGKSKSTTTPADEISKSDALPIDVVFSFDTTGSMYPCLTQVRRVISQTVDRLFREIKNIRIGIIAHGDYCDQRVYVTKHLELTAQKKKIQDFLHSTPSTYGGDYPECYELVLHEARSFNWGSGRSKILVMFGDAFPHESNHHENRKNLDWKNEAGLLTESGISIYSVQCLNNPRSDYFWAFIASVTNGMHLTLDQFANAPDLMQAICYKQAGDEQLKKFESELVAANRMNRNLDMSFAILTGKAPAWDHDALVPRGPLAFVPRDRSRGYRSTRFSAVPAGLNPVPAGRFQVLDVEDDTPIREFAEDNGLEFQPGRGFYEFTKRVKVQAYKEVILMDNKTGDFFYGKDARKLLGLPESGDVHINPRDSACAGYTAFIQSTSYNRKLIAGTKFLYEVTDWSTVPSV